MSPNVKMFQVYVFYECVLDVLCIYLVTDAGSCADRYTDTSCLCINTSDRVNFHFLLLLWDLKTRFFFLSLLRFQTNSCPHQQCLKDIRPSALPALATTQHGDSRTGSEGAPSLLPGEVARSGRGFAWEFYLEKRIRETQTSVGDLFHKADSGAI